MSLPQEKLTLICLKCNVPLELRKTSFTYLGFNFKTDLPKCPVCGQVYLSEELVKGKVTEVETSLEDK
jgi:ssDNA-binding Zn-finger/Zn-ribbon topoisomerase 1